MRSLKLTLSIVALVGAVNAGAACYGTSAYQTCNDDAGNTYTVQRYGNTTEVRGSNLATGSTCDQTTQTYGNLAQHQGGQQRRHLERHKSDHRRNDNLTGHRQRRQRIQHEMHIRALRLGS